MRNVILNCRWALGDVVLLTAAVRDLHLSYPGKFQTDVRSYHPEVWRHNPYIVPLDPDADDVEVLDCEYPLINRSNQTPHHCIHGFRHFLNKHLGLEIEPAAFKGDIHLSEKEKTAPSKIERITGSDVPFWIIDAGGKYDLTIKWWSTERFQKVVNHFKGKLLFVQIGAKGDWHPGLEGTIDLRGRTSVRELIQLMYHAQGVLCGVTGAMHIAAAVGTKAGLPPRRPCVVIAGGREPAHWEAYPEHQFIHTLGALKCCTGGGCWRSRTLPLGDGHARDDPDKRCVDVVADLPRCMDMITPNKVIQRIESYFEHPANAYLTHDSAIAVERGIAATRNNPFDALPLHDRNARCSSEFFLKNLPDFDGGNLRITGIVTCAAGPRFSINAWICIKMLRNLGCKLPIELWSVAAGDLDDQFKAMVSSLGVTIRVASEIPRCLGTSLSGSSLKPFAIVHSEFKNVLWLDSDNVPVADPTYLFSTDQFRRLGAVFWRNPIAERMSSKASRVFGVDPTDEQAVETGQILVNKERCWKALNLATWYHGHSSFFASLATSNRLFQLSFWKTETRFTTPDAAPVELNGATVHHDFDGVPLFQHRNRRKWEFERDNANIEGFQHEETCIRFSDELLRQWNGRWSDTSQRASQRGAARGKRLWHVCVDFEPSELTSEKRICLAKSTWSDQYRRGNWCRLTAKNESLPRNYRDEIRRVFYLKDIVAQALQRAEPDDIIVLTDAETCAAPSLTRRLIQVFRKVDACYSYRRGVRSLSRSLSDEQIYDGELSSTCGLFAFSVGWWNGNSSALEDYLVGAPSWDTCFRKLIQRTELCEDYCFDNLIYQDLDSLKLDRHSGPPLSSERYNDTLARRFAKRLDLNFRIGAADSIPLSIPGLDTPNKWPRSLQANGVKHIHEQKAIGANGRSVLAANGSAIDRSNAREMADHHLANIAPYPGHYRDRGIVICGGGEKYFPSAWVCIRMLRHLGCHLPIQLWHLGINEVDLAMKALVAPHGVECVDALEVRKRHPSRILKGWELKPYAMIHCPFKEVLILDADNVPVRNPEYLFDEPDQLSYGATFWPDRGNLPAAHPAWSVFGVDYRDEPEFESGQVVLNKEACWRELNLTMFYNEYSDFYYHVIHGDKETFHMAWRKLNRNYAMPKRRLQELPHAVFCQHDFQGERVFQHRTLAKWKLHGVNQRVDGFFEEDKCLEFLEQLGEQWEGAVVKPDPIALS